MDIHSKEIRSYNMSKVKNSNTKPELIVRKYLFSKGFRYRKNVKGLPGCPDIVLPKYRVVIFVNGCFWHIHEGCAAFSWPKTNRDFWEKKLKANKQRDLNNYEILGKIGWNVLIVWECELKKESKDIRLKMLVQQIENISKKDIT